MRKVIDAKGMNCPMPVIMAKKEIDNGGKSFEVLVDNKIAVENLKKLANSQGFNTSDSFNNGEFKVIFSDGCIECEEVLAKVENRKPVGNWAIFINKATIGVGAEELGESLMKMFLYTLTEGEDLPSKILFMNDGVKVPTLNNQAIEHLKELQEKGVDLLVCGACLNFYNLEDKLSVGRVSNMYEILDVMKTAEKVITI